MDLAGAPPTIVEGLFCYDIGGGERIAADVAMGFQRRGFRVLAFGMYGNEGPLRQELEAADIECVDLNYLTRSRITRRVTYQAELFRFLRRERVAALHMHYGTALIVAGRAAQLARVPRVVVTEHATHQYEENARYRAATSRRTHLASAITVVHANQANYWVNTLRADRDRIFHIPNGVRIPAKRPDRNLALRAEYGVAPADFLFIALGRLHETKDLPTLLAAFEKVVSQCANAKLWLVGEGPERGRLESLIRERQLGARVTLLGARQDVMAVLAAGDALAMSSRTEGMPMALLEAMACRVPCVATSVGGVPHLLREGAGLTVPPHAPQALAEQMQRLVCDPTLRNDLGERGLHRVRADHDLEHSVTRYLELFGLPAEWPPRP
jgi:glycosyltransferase involved in cell wall biosynthesis